MNQHGHIETQKNKAEGTNVFESWIYAGHRTNFLRMLEIEIYPLHHVRPALVKQYEARYEHGRRFLTHEMGDDP